MLEVLLLIIICSMHSTCGVLYCFGGVCAAASTILVVAIAKFGSYDKNRDKKQGTRGQRHNLLCSHRIVSTCRLLPATVLRTACSVGRN